MIESLDAFTCVPEFSRKHTTFRVYAQGQKEPVARAHKDSAWDTRFPYHVFEGPGLDRLVGYVTPWEAMTADRVRIGRVDRRSGSAARRDKWSFQQSGLPELLGGPDGRATKLRHSFPLRAVLANAPADALFSLRLLFQGAGSNGFELTRQSGLNPRYSVRIHDERVDRLLVLACVALVNRDDDNPRQFLADIASNPLKG